MKNIYIMILLSFLVFQLSGCSNPDSDTAYASYRLVKKTDTSTSAVLSYIYEYNSDNNNLYNKIINYKDGVYTGYTISEYDSENRLIKGSSYDTDGNLTLYAVHSDFTANGNPATIEIYLNGSTNPFTKTDISYTYDSNNVITKVVHNNYSSGTLVSTATNTMDSHGNTATTTYSYTNGSSPTTYSYTNIYDKNENLLKVQKDGKTVITNEYEEYMEQ